MSMQGDIAREGMLESVLKKVAEMIEVNQGNPEVVKTLKMLGASILFDSGLPNVPAWTAEYFKKFST